MKFIAYTLIFYAILLSSLEIRMGLQFNETILMLGLFFIGFSFLRVEHTADLLWKKDILFTIASFLLLSSYVLMLTGGIVQHRISKLPLFYTHIFFDMLYFLTLVTKCKRYRIFLITVTVLYILSQSILMIGEIKSLLGFLESTSPDLEKYVKTAYVIIWDIFRISLLIIAYRFIQNKPAVP